MPENLDEDAINWIFENRSIVSVGVLGSYLLCNICWSIGSAISVGATVSIGGICMFNNNLPSFLPEIFGLPMQVLIRSSLNKYDNETAMTCRSKSLFALASGVTKKIAGSCVVTVGGILAGLLLTIEIEHVLQLVEENSQTTVVALIAVFFFSTVMGVSLFLLVAMCSFIMAQIFALQQALLFVSIAAGVGGMAGSLVSYSIGRCFQQESIPSIGSTRAYRILSALRLMPLARRFHSLNISAGITGVSFSPFLVTLFLSLPRIVCVAFFGAYVGSWCKTGATSEYEDMSLQIVFFTDIFSSLIGFILLATEVKARQRERCDTLNGADHSKEANIEQEGSGLVAVIEAITAAILAVMQAIIDIISGGPSLNDDEADHSREANIEQEGSGFVAVIEAITAAILAVMQAIIDIINGGPSLNDDHNENVNLA